MCKLRRKGLIADPIGIGMVFQQAALFDSLTVEENVGFSLYQRSNLPRSRIQELVNTSWRWWGWLELANATQPSCRVECVSGSVLQGNYV